MTSNLKLYHFATKKNSLEKGSNEAKKGDNFLPIGGKLTKRTEGMCSFRGRTTPLFSAMLAMVMHMNLFFRDSRGLGLHFPYLRTGVRIIMHWTIEKSITVFN